MTMASQVSTDSVRLTLTDAEMAARLVEGDGQALAEAYRRHGSRVIAVANAVLRDQGAAEDICHDVFIHLARHPQRFDSDRGSLVAYLVVVAHGRALDRLRSEQARKRREERQARFGPVASAGADDKAIASSMAAQVWAAVSALPAHEAEALRLAYFGGSSYREVAGILQVAEGTVKSRIRSGLRRLRVTFVDQGIIAGA